MTPLREKLEALRQDIDMHQEHIRPTRRELAIFALIDVALAARRPKDDSRTLPEYLVDLADALARLEEAMG